MGDRPRLLFTNSTILDRELLVRAESLGFAASSLPLTGQSSSIALGELYAQVAGMTWLVLFSRQAAGFFAEHAAHDPRLVKDFKIAVMGEGTEAWLAAQLRPLGHDFKANFSAAGSTSRDFAADFVASLETPKGAGLSIATLQSDIGRDDFADVLRKAGSTVKKIELYVTRPDTQGQAKIAAIIDEKDRAPIYAMLASPSAVRALATCGAKRRPLIISIGPTTSHELAKFPDWPSAAEAASPTFVAMIDAAKGHWEREML